MTRIEKLAVYFKYASDENKKDYVQEILAEEDLAMSENAYRTLTQDEFTTDKAKPYGWFAESSRGQDLPPEAVPGVRAWIA